MELKPGFNIRMLTAIQAGDIIIPKGDVVKVVKVTDGSITIEDILGNKVILPSNARFKLLKTQQYVPASMIGAPIPRGSVLREDNLVVPSQFRNRVLQLAQVITSMSLSCNDPIVLQRLNTAATMLMLAISGDMTPNQFNRLYQFARKLSAS